MRTTLHQLQIERVVEPSWRKTRHAIFQRPDGFYLCDVWFSEGLPKMQIRSGAGDFEEALAVSIAIGMAIEWAEEEIASGKNVPQLEDINE